MNPHATVESNFQHQFSVSVWCGILNSQLIGPFIFEGHLTGDIYLQFLQDELLPLLDSVPSATRLHMCFHHDGAPLHFSHAVKMHLWLMDRSLWCTKLATQVS